VKTLKSKHSSANVVVTGHSLGAAEAMLAAVVQRQLGYNVLFYSYGCPRVGEKNFSDFFDGLITGTNLRAVYKNDPVPTVPYHDLMNYDHAGTEVHFYDCSNYIAYPYDEDDYPLTNLLAIDDHGGYRCLVNGNSATA